MALQDLSPRTKNVSIGVLIAAAGLLFPANSMYVQWHDDNYVTKFELSQVNDVVVSHDEILGEVSEQLTGIRVQGAVSVASALQNELDQLESRPETSSEYRLRVSTLRNRVQQAVQYRDCLWEGRANCEAIRGY